MNKAILHIYSMLLASVIFLVGALLSTVPTACTQSPHVALTSQSASVTRTGTFYHIGTVRGSVVFNEPSPFNSEGSQFYTKRDGELFQVWDSTTLKPISEPMRHRQADQNRFSEDGKTLFTSDQHEVKVWDVTMAKLLSATKVTERMLIELEVSPDGKFFATKSVGDDEVVVWSVGQCRPVQRFRQEFVRSMKFDRIGKHLLTHIGPKAVHVWSIESGKEVCSPVQTDFNGANIFTLPFDSTEKRLVIPRWFSEFFIADLTTGKKAATINVAELDEIDSVQYVDNGTKILVMGLKRSIVAPILVYNEKTLSLEREFGNGLILCQASVHSHFALCRRPINSGIELWDLNTGLTVQSFPSVGKYGSAFLSPDGSTILLHLQMHLSSEDNVTEVWHRQP